MEAQLLQNKQTNIYILVSKREQTATSTCRVQLFTCDLCGAIRAPTLTSPRASHLVDTIVTIRWTRPAVL